MQDTNLVILVGRLGKDPELKYDRKGKAYVRFPLATSDTWKDNDGNRQEKTQWHTIIAWAKLAEIMVEYLKKGTQVLIMGKIEYRKFQGENNKDIYITEIKAYKMQIMGKKKVDNDNENSDKEIDDMSF